MLQTGQKDLICEQCPIARVADLVGDSCVLIIIRDLLNGPRRFAELSHSLSGVSTRTLSSKLKYLETEGIITRHAFAEKPPRVEYALTIKGTSLSKIIKEMRMYGEKFV